jgi:hypothetical protein
MKVFGFTFHTMQVAGSFLASHFIPFKLHEGFLIHVSFLASCFEGFRIQGCSPASCFEAFPILKSLPQVVMKVL